MQIVQTDSGLHGKRPTVSSSSMMAHNTAPACATAATLLYDFCKESKVSSCRKVLFGSFRPLRHKCSADFTTQNPEKHKAKSFNINPETRFSFPFALQKYGCLPGDMQILTTDIASQHKSLSSDKNLAFCILPMCDF